MDLIRVQGINDPTADILFCFFPSSFKLEETLNQTRQISFTAYDDNTVAYLKLQNENSIWFDNQEYIIKQVQDNSVDGVETKAITATHIQFDLVRVRQRATRSGTLTYSPQNVLGFYLNGNQFGYTYQVIGNFPKEEITDLGNSNGQDMLSKITSTWDNAVVYADNKNIKVFTLEAFKKTLGNRIDYQHNTSNIQLTIDTTTPLVNQLMCFGKTQETSDTNQTKYYFEPFIVEDKQSIQKYGLWVGDDLSDERFTNVNSMRAYALTKLQGEPSISISVTRIDNSLTRPILGEVKHLKVDSKNLEADLTLIGFTWYPFDNTQSISETYSNLPSSILRTNILINRRLKNLSEENKRQEKIRKELETKMKAYQEMQDSLSMDITSLNSLINSMIEHSKSQSLSESMSVSESISISESQSKSLSESVSQVASESASKSISTSEIGSEK